MRCLADRPIPRQLEDNIEFAGIRLDSSDSVVIEANSTAQRRVHTLSGAIESAPTPVSFRLIFHVREPLDGTDQESGQQGMGREYVIERMLSEMDGANHELHDAISGLDLEEQPNPPAFFAALRQWSTLATARVELFACLRSEFPRHAARPHSPDPAAVETELAFSSLSNAPTLILSYLLQPNPASYTLRTAQPLIPHLSLRADIPPSLPTSAHNALEAIPAQFERMLHEGFEPQKAVEAIVRAVFVGDATEI
ncbi:hypothetical protein JCM3770_004025 [Rhodotorula araucariae]